MSARSFRWFVAALFLCIPLAANAVWNQTEFLVGARVLNPSMTHDGYVNLDYCGLDFIVNDPNWSPPQCRDAIIAVAGLHQQSSLARLRIIADHRINLQDMCGQNVAFNDSSIGFNTDADSHWSAMASAIDAMRQGLPGGPSFTSAILGFNLWDEPLCPTHLQAAAKASRRLNDNYNFLPLVNLFPSSVYFSNQQYGALYPGGDVASDYGLYLGTYLTMFDSSTLPVLSFDHYLFQDGGGSEADRHYFTTLRLIRDYARGRSTPTDPVPFWSTVQISSRQNSLLQNIHVPTPGEIRWQIYAPLAYGAKGMTYWTAAPLHLGDEFGEHYDAGIITSSGDRAQHFNLIKDLNSELHNLGPTLIRLDPVRTVHVNALSYYSIGDEILQPSTPGLVRDVLGTGREYVLAGQLKDRVNGDDYLLVMNKSTSTSISVAVQLPSHSSVYHVSKQSGTTDLISGGSSQILLEALAAGDGELFKVVPLPPGPPPVGGGSGGGPGEQTEPAMQAPRIDQVTVENDGGATRFVISLSLQADAGVSLEVLDIAGRKVAGRSAERMTAGRHRITVDADALQNGMYFVRAVGTSGEAFAKKVAVLD